MLHFKGIFPILDVGGGVSVGRMTGQPGADRAVGNWRVRAENSSQVLAPYEEKAYTGSFGSRFFYWT